jgi:hypothetical protein
MRAGNVLNSILSGKMVIIDAPENFADSIFRLLIKSLCSDSKTMRISGTSEGFIELAWCEIEFTQLKV